MRLRTVGCLSKSRCVEALLNSLSLLTTEPSEDDVELLDAVGIRSISWLGRP